MEEFIQFSAKNKSEAITKACMELGTSSDKLDIQIVSEGSSGFFGIGAKPAIIKARRKVTVQEEDEIKDSSYLREQVKILRATTNIDVFFKDLIKVPEVSALLMIVDDSGKNPGKKRQAVLNREFKYIGISSKFIGRTFIAYFAFSK